VEDKEESQMDEDVFGRKSKNPLEIWKQIKNPKSHFALIKYLIHFSYQFVTFFFHCSSSLSSTFKLRFINY
jgi:hypothetical protein